MSSDPVWVPVAHYRSVWGSRSYVELNRKTRNKTILVYRSKSGLMWHMTHFDLKEPTKLVKRAGEYSTSFIIDLELQKRIEEFLHNKPPVRDLTRRVLDQKMRDSKMVDGLYSITDRESNTMICKEKESPVSVFLDIMSWMRKKGIPVCGGAGFAKQKIQNGVDGNDQDILLYRESKDKSTFDLYRNWSKTITGILGQYMRDDGQDLFLYEAFQYLENICFRKYLLPGDDFSKYNVKEVALENKSNEEWVKGNIFLSYKIYARRIKSGKRFIQRQVHLDKDYNSYVANNFELVYARYKIIFEKNDRNDDRDIISKEFVIPLFILNNEQLDADVPVYKNVAAAGLYTCKMFEYRNQLFGAIHAVSRPAANEYAFIGDAMDKMWPFHNEDSMNNRLEKRQRLELLKL